MRESRDSSEASLGSVFQARDQSVSRSADLSALLARVAGRDRQAFAALHEATRAKLYGVALRILKERDLADEVIQDAFVRIWERAADFDPEKGSALGWMSTIARNRSLDELRRRSSRLRFERGDGELADVASPERGPLASLEYSEDFRGLFHCLDQLDAERREMILLAYLDGLGREALAQRFSRPVGTIKSWLQRSLAQLKACLEQ